MPYESLIGWRFLYRGRSSPVVTIGLVLCIVGAVGAGAWFFLGGRPSPVGVAILVAGALGSITFGLLMLFRVFSTVSVLGVILGVAALTAVLAVTSGFQTAFREKVLGVNAHVVVIKAVDFADYQEVEELAASTPHVVAVQPFVIEEVLVTKGKGELSGVGLKGVDPDRVGTVLALPQHMIEGSVGALKERTPGVPPPLILGRELAHKLKTRVGDVIKVVSPLTGIDLRTWSPTGRPPKSREFTVRGVFYSGFDEYDRRLVYVNIKDAQDFLEQGDLVRGVEMKLDDVDQAKDVAAAIEQKLGGDPYVVMDWRTLNDSLFTALTIQKVALLVVLTLIIVVAAFNMVAALTMMVLDKIKEIAILKSMGGTAVGVAAVFQIVGLTIGAVGTGLGLGLGLLVCRVLARYAFPLDPRVYSIDRLPIQVNFSEVVLVGAITMAICFLATLYPALKASFLRPVEGLRYE
ncbi:MAG: ABC transporter permease [Pseudomonadota bacterium]